MVTISSLVGFTMIVSVPGKHRSDSRQAKKGNAPSKPPNPKGQNRKSSGSLTRLLIGSVTAPALTEQASENRFLAEKLRELRAS